MPREVEEPLYFGYLSWVPQVFRGLSDGHQTPLWVFQPLPTQRAYPARLGAGTSMHHWRDVALNETHTALEPPRRQRPAFERTNVERGERAGVPRARHRGSRGTGVGTVVQRTSLRREDQADLKEGGSSEKKHLDEETKYFASVIPSLRGDLEEGRCIDRGETMV